MNLFSFALAVIAACIFAGAFKGHKWGSLGAGLCILTVAWVLQLIWVAHSGDIIIR